MHIKMQTSQLYWFYNLSRQSIKFILLKQSALPYNYQFITYKLQINLPYSFHKILPLISKIVKLVCLATSDINII